MASQMYTIFWLLGLDVIAEPAPIAFAAVGCGKIPIGSSLAALGKASRGLEEADRYSNSNNSTAAKRGVRSYVR